MDSKNLNRNPAAPAPEDPAETKKLFVVQKTSFVPKEKFKTYTAGGQTVIRSEFSDRLEQLTHAYMAEHKPGGPTEMSLVRDLAAAQCRSEYAVRLQSQPGVAANEKMMSTLKRYQSTNQSLFKRSLKMLMTIRKERQREAARKPYIVKPRITGGC